MPSMRSGTISSPFSEEGATEGQAPKTRRTPRRSLGATSVTAAMVPLWCALIQEQSGTTNRSPEESARASRRVLCRVNTLTAARPKVSGGSVSGNLGSLIHSARRAPVRAAAAAAISRRPRRPASPIAAAARPGGRQPTQRLGLAKKRSATRRLGRSAIPAAAAAAAADSKTPTGELLGRGPEAQRLGVPGDALGGRRRT
mmetsp:Transcript_78168/g.253733  ORF Transcript_78168/g.253733 Transcript_78168/m.253733 type:complete len:200 (+) Transcript_78168:484-1083(+)